MSNFSKIKEKNNLGVSNLEFFWFRKKILDGQKILKKRFVGTMHLVASHDGTNPLHPPGIIYTLGTTN